MYKGVTFLKNYIILLSSKTSNNVTLIELFESLNKSRAIPRIF